MASERNSKTDLMMADTEYSGVGAQLRREREQLNLGIDQVAEQIRIRGIYLNAIEMGEFDKLPGQIYVTGFLRTYAQFLGLDATTIVKAYEGEGSVGPHSAPLIFPTAAAQPHAPRGWMIALALALIGLVYGAWYQFSHKGQVRVETVAAVPERLEQAAPPLADPAAQAAQLRTEQARQNQQQALATTPSATHTADAVPATSVPSTGASSATALSSQSQVEVSPLASPNPIVSTPAAAGSTASALRENAPIIANASPASAEAASTATGQVFGNPDARSRVTIKATAESWVDIRSTNNEVVFPSRVMKSGDVYYIPDRADMRLWTGNLGALEFSVDGNVLPRLGNLGEARRNIQLDAAKLLAGAAVPR